MSELLKKITNLDLHEGRPSQDVNEDIAKALRDAGYDIALYDYSRPWGGFNQLANDNADRFIEEFFPGAIVEARLGNPQSELSPKILTVAPGQRLSWQYHNRRAERWVYLTEGAYYKSLTDNQGEMRYAQPGEVVQFEKAERHRLIGAVGHYTLVAEIWQHTDVGYLSDEEDIVRLEDDYNR